MKIKKFQKINKKVKKVKKIGNKQKTYHQFSLSYHKIYKKANNKK